LSHYLGGQTNHFDLRSETANQKGINYRIGDFIGSTLGQKADRYLRNFVGYIYLNKKIGDGAYK